MNEVITIGVDLAKNVFQVHGVDAEGAVVFRRQLRRAALLQEATAVLGGHGGVRHLASLGAGDRGLGAPGAFDGAQVCEALCEAEQERHGGCRGHLRSGEAMRFVEIKTREQQSVLMLHRTRHLFVRQSTMVINALRAHLAEFGIVAGVGRNGLERLLDVIEDGEDDRVPPTARDCLLALRAQLEMVKHRILDADRRILAWHRRSEVSQRLAAIPGVGPLIATALVASVPDPHAFESGRDLAAWIGLVPRQNSTGGKERLGHISKAGNRYLRMLLVVGALSVIRRAKQTGYTRRPWLTKLLERRSTKVAAIALANKNARTAWAMMAHGTYYEEPVSQAA